MRFYLSIALLLIGAATYPLYSQTKTTSKTTSGKSVAATTNAQSETLTNKNIIALHNASLNAEMIISKIESSPCKFDLSTNSLIELKKAGVRDEVIEAMMDKSKGEKIATEKSETNKLEGKVSQVEIINHPYYYNEASSTLKPLEKTVSSISTKYIALGYGGVRFQYEIQGEASSIRLSQAESVSFLINTTGTTLPELVLYKVKPEKGKRNAVAMQAKALGGMKSGDNVMVFNTASVSNGIYKITPAQKLEPGEYFFAGKPVTGSTTIDVYTFGID